MSTKPTYEELEKKVKDLEQGIAEPKTAEEAFRRSEEKYRSILENIEDEYYEVDLEGRYTFANKAVCQNQGLSREELIGMNFQDHMNPEEAKRVYKIFREVYRTGFPANLINYEVFRKDGTILSFEDSITLIRDSNGKPIGFAGIGRNISKRKKNEEALQVSEKKYRNILENISEGYYEVDLNGNLTFFNEALTRMHGRSSEEMMGLNHRDYTAPETSKRIFKIFNEMYKGGLPTRIIDYEIIRKDGSIIMAEFSASLLKDPSGKTVGFCGIVRDRTEQKRAEEALAESEEKYRNILENMEEAYYEVDLAGNFTFFNEAMRRVYNRTYEELMGMNFREYAHPEDVERIYSVYHQVYNQKIPPAMFDFRIIRIDGEIRSIEGAVDLLRDESGKPIGFHGITRDRTDQKKAEEALRESEDKYRNILESIEEVYYEVDLTGNLTFFNPAMCETFGRIPEDLLGLNYREYTSPEGASLLYSVYHEVFKTGTPKYLFDFPIIRIDRAVRILEGSVSLMRNAAGEPVGFRGIVRDKTEQKKAEQALRESEEKYRLLVEHAYEGIYILQDGVMKFSNPRAEEITGYSRSAMAEMSFMDSVHPKDRPYVLDQQNQKPVEGKKPGPYSFRIINQKEEALWVELNHIEIEWEGRPATLNFLRDITPQKKMETQFLQAQKMEAVGTLAGGIAHDFNNLLMGIQGNASLILLDIGSDHPHYSKIKNIEKQVQAGAELTRQLLGAARGGKYETRATNLNDLIGRSLDLFGRAKKELRIHKYFQEPIWAVEVDRSQIEQVLLNLYVNAGHAMPAGGNLYVETKNIFLDENYLQPYGLTPGKYVRISVTDTGVGMDEATQKRAFDPFFTTREVGRGTGLGLASAYGIVKNHNGIINIYSEIGEGTTVNIYLPATEKAIIEKPELREEVSKGNESILLVDDEEAIADIGRHLLKRLGYHVIQAGSGAEAVEIYRREQGGIDLIILDMIMPGISGGETFDQLKAVNSSVRVLLSSGYSINGQAQTILDRGCKGFLQKPFSLVDLSKKVRQVLDEKL